MAAICQHRTRAPALPGQHGVRVGSRAVCLVTALLAVEVHARIRAFSSCASGWLLVVINPAEALLACPCLQQSAIYREVLIRKEVALARLFEHGGEERISDVPIEQTLSVLR